MDTCDALSSQNQQMVEQDALTGKNSDVVFALTNYNSSRLIGTISSLVIPKNKALRQGRSALFCLSEG